MFLVLGLKYKVAVEIGCTERLGGLDIQMCSHQEKGCYYENENKQEGVSSWKTEGNNKAGLEWEERTLVSSSRKAQ